MESLLTYKRANTIVAMLTLLCTLSAGAALADGLQGKDKVRTPQQTIDLHNRKLKPLITDTSAVVLPVPEKEAVGQKVRQKARLTERAMQLIYGKPASQNVTPDNAVDREHLIRRGRQYEELKCNLLHTHERATCLRDSQLQRFVRFETVRVSMR